MPSSFNKIHLLRRWSFNNSAEGKNVALGNGLAQQVTMPGYKGEFMAPLEVTDNPVPGYNQDKYQFKCGSMLYNPRLADCE